LSNVLFESDNVIGRAHSLFAFIIVLHKKINSTFIAKYLQKFIIYPKNAIFKLYEFNKIMQISFGKKIPIATCSIINKVTKQPQNVTIFEHDCKDKEDYEYFMNLAGAWNFKENVALQAYSKHNLPSTNMGTKIYSMETQSGKTIGIMETYELNKTCTVEHLEAHQRGLYGYIGSSMLAYLSQRNLINNISSIVITNPSKNARKFYKEHCFFTDCPPIALEINRNDMKKLIEKTKSKTQSPIIDLRG